MYTYIPPFLPPLPIFTHLGHHRHRAELTVLYSRFPLAISHMAVRICPAQYLCSSFPIHPNSNTLSPFNVLIHFQHLCLYSCPTKTLSPVSFWNHPKIFSFSVIKIFSSKSFSFFFLVFLYLQWVSLYIHLLKLCFLVILWNILIAASLYLSIKSHFQTFRIYFISDVPFLLSFLPSFLLLHFLPSFFLPSLLWIQLSIFDILMI